MTHLETWEMEKYSAAETDWERWVNRAEYFAGHSLDGDWTVDGYSLDYAHDAYENGISAKAYVTSIVKR